MAEKTVSPDTHVVNPMFPIPEGLVGYTYGTEDPDLLPIDTEEQLVEGDSEEIQNDSELLNYEDFLGDLAGKPVTPDILGIVSQTIHIGATGQQVVDLVLDVEDVPGVEYEFQVAKI